MDGERVAYFLVNMSGEWLAFVPAETNPNVDCPVRWDERRQIFSGPCLGTRYRLTGEWCDGPAVRNLDQYPVEINNDRVWVHTDYVIAGEATAVYKAANGNRSPGCPIPP